MRCPDCGHDDAAGGCPKCGWKASSEGRAGGYPMACDKCLLMGMDPPHMIQSPEDHLAHRAEAHRTIELVPGKPIPWAGPDGQLVPEARPCNRDVAGSGEASAEAREEA